MMKTFKQHGYDKTNPAMYSMICWITDANEFSGTAGMTFEEFV
jgi:Ca2+-binding EF-hand superfamily protein